MSNQKQGDLQRGQKQSGQGDQNRNEAQDDQQGQPVRDNLATSHRQEGGDA